MCSDLSVGHYRCHLPVSDFVVIVLPRMSFYFFFFKGSGAHRDLPSSPTRRSSDLWARPPGGGDPGAAVAAHAALRAAVGEVSCDALLAWAAPEVSVSLALPAPAAPDRGNGEHQSVATAVDRSLRTVHLPALLLGPAEAIDFLTSLPRELPPSCGPSVAYWATLARFVVRLIAARQFLPRLESNDEDASLSACWRVLVSDRTQLQWLEGFAAALPPGGPAAGAEAAPVVGGL